MYKLKYIDKLDVYKSSTSTCIGTLMHSTLEYLYGEEDDTVETAEDAFYRVLVPAFKDFGLDDAEAILGDLLEYNEDISGLYLRASASYMGADAIRTKAGKVPKSPEMTGVWKEECRRMDLDSRKSRIDYVVQQKSGLESVSITDVYAKANNLAVQYDTPSEIHEIISLELPLSHWDYKTNTLRNPVLFPGCSIPNVYLNGYVDNVCKLKLPDGRIVNAVIDYKTSKEEFNENIVAHNQQLLAYAKGVEILLGIDIDYIGILSIPFNKLVYAPVMEEVQEDILDNYNKIIRYTQEGKFVKHVPDSKYSPCMSSFGSECPFLENCWPNSYEFLQAGRIEPDFSDYFI